GTRLSSAADALARALAAADQEGLDPSDYGVDAIDRLRHERLDPARAADVDLQLTAAYLSYGWDLIHGSSRPEDVDPQWHPSPRDVDLVAALERGLDERRVEDSLAHLAPTAPQYAGLRQQLHRYREMAAKGVHDD